MSAKYDDIPSVRWARAAFSRPLNPPADSCLVCYGTGCLNCRWIGYEPGTQPFNQTIAEFEAWLDAYADNRR